MQQPIMNVAARQVQRGKWLHVFPEGKLFVDGSMGPFKWGIGKMVCDSMEDGRRYVRISFLPTSLIMLMCLDRREENNPCRFFLKMA